MKCPNCKEKLNNQEKSCPNCGTWIGYDNRIETPEPAIHKREKDELIKKVKENPYFGLILEANKPLCILAASWLFFFLILMLLAYIFD